MRRLTFYSICAALLIGSAHANESVPHYRAVVQVVGQTYCFGDNDVFTVSLDLRIQVINSSRTALLLPSDMVPYTGRVAASTDSITAGHYIQEWTPSRYLTNSRTKAHGIQVKPGHSFVLRLKYSVPGRYRATPSVPGTIPSGTYALQLVLHREGLSPLRRQPRRSGSEVDSLTTVPVLFHIPQSVTATPCH